MPLFNITYDPGAARRAKKLEELGRTIFDVQTQTGQMQGPARPGETLPEITTQTPTGLLADNPNLGKFARAGIEAGGPISNQVIGGILRQQGFGAGQGDPSAVREYEYFSKLTPEQQKTYLGIKRQGYQVKDVAGVPTLVSMIPGQDNIPLSSLQQEVEAKSEKAKGAKTGEDTAKQISSGLDQAQKIGANIQNLEDVVSLVKEGASTGPIMSKLPSFRAASVELDNMQKRLGLDVIGSVTFGALSEAELKMALDTALPTKLKGNELVQWAKNKINAQRKLKNYFEEQARYLSQPGASRSGWIEQQKQKPQQSPQGPTKGTVQDGYIFMGGDPADPKSWKPQ